MLFSVFETQVYPCKAVLKIHDISLPFPYHHSSLPKQYMVICPHQFIASQLMSNYKLCLMKHWTVSDWAHEIYNTRKRTSSCFPRPDFKGQCPWRQNNTTSLQERGTGKIGGTQRPTEIQKPSPQYYRESLSGGIPSQSKEDLCSVSADSASTVC